MSDIQKLIGMGFEKSKVEFALRVTNYKGIEQARHWLLAHRNKVLPRQRGGSNSDAASSNRTRALRQSFKCEDCGKVLRNEAEMQYHAAKTNHSNFSESTEEKAPLTEKERQAQLALIEEKLKQKRLEREENERINAKEREKARIRTSRDLTEARRKMQEMEFKEVVDQRKREKAEDNAARNRVRAQIEADKAERRAREQEHTAKAASTIVPSNSIRSADVISTSKNYTETRIQIRLLDGSTLMETFNIEDHLSAVRTYIQTKIGTDTPFQLMTSFPRKVFTDEDYEKSLSAVGLVPTAVLTMTKLVSTLAL